MSLSETYFHWLQSCRTISFIFSILPAFHLAFFQESDVKPVLSTGGPGGELQRVSLQRRNVSCTHVPCFGIVTEAGVCVCVCVCV